MKTVVITGANSGLGFETAKKIAANQNFKVILACRNMAKAAAAKEQIARETGSQNIEAMNLDTSSLRSVRAFAEQIVSRGEKIYALVNNAGISPAGEPGASEDGFERVFATNYLGHFLLTQLLLPVMAEGGRIYNVSSDMHNPPGGIAWHGAESLAHPKTDDRKKYSYSKLCMIYMTHELAKRLKEDGRKITVNAFNPGFMADTNFAKGNAKARALVVKATMPKRYGTLAESSAALARLVTDEEFAGASGEYFDRGVSAVKSSELSYNDDNAKELWNASMRFTGL